MDFPADWLAITWQQLAWPAVGVVLVFWMIGAYNRLMRLRNRIGAAWSQAEPLLSRRDEALTPLIAALREPLVDETGALDALATAQIHVRSAADAMRARPDSADAARLLASTLGPWASSFSRLSALLEQRPTVQQSEGVAQWLAAVQDTQTRWPFVRQAFNEAVQVYNDAASQWPTRWLSRVFGFRPAGAL
jgi:LemA protein